MLGSVALEATPDDWPPSPHEAASGGEQRPFQFVWTHFPEAKSRYYAERTYSGVSLRTPLDRTKWEFSGDMRVQVGFTMDVMLEGGGGGPVAMVFNPVGAGAFVDSLPGSEQSLCLDIILRAIFENLQRRCCRRPCVLFLSGSARCPGAVTWKNKLGWEATVEVPEEVRDRVFVGPFDCLAMAQRLANSGAFASVGVTMAADKHRIGNAFLSIREDCYSGALSFSAQNAADENNTRRSSLLPWVLRLNASEFSWGRLHKADVQDAADARWAAKEYLDKPSEPGYRRMMKLYQRMLTRGALAPARDRRWFLSIPDLVQRGKITSLPVAQEQETAPVDG